MLNSKHFTYFFLRALGLLSLLALASCMPAPTTAKLDSSSATGPGSPTSTTVYPNPTFPLADTFLQEGTTQTSNTLNLASNFSDSFLIRGEALSTYLKSLPSSTKFCLVGKYTYTAGSDKFLILAAKTNTFTDLVKKTTENYLQVEPANDTANQNDCLSYNLTNRLYATARNPASSFSFAQLCANCSASVSSVSLQLYFVNGETIPTITLPNAVLTISGSTSAGTTGCSESTSCKARGYNCCLQGQCVNDGAMRPGASLLPGYASAVADVLSNPSRFTVYPQYYFVCATRPDSTTGGSAGGTVDPTYAANVRLMEMTQLYNCLNKVDGEFSYCTVKFTEASKAIPGNFSAASLGLTDDVNFTSLNPNYSGDYSQNVVKIIYAGKTLFELGKTPLSSGSFVSGSANDNLTTAQAVNVTEPFPANALDDNLYLTYKIDGTCDKVGTALAKCTKTYVQGSSDTLSTTWHDGSSVFQLPAYADLTYNLIVKVGGLVVAEDSSTWTKFTGPNRIEFSGSYPVYQNQKIEITYFVTSNIAQLTGSKSAAQASVNSMCSCAAGVKCNLRPVFDTSNHGLTNYECVYDSAASAIPPANQTVFVSSKNVPHRYYDVNGVVYDGDVGGAPPQEGTAFSYTNSDVLKPTNVGTYTGFNEIYGSFTSSAASAKPAKLVNVKNQTTYDIYVNSGSFSSCVSCGSDYYSALQKIFPINFTGKGGGYSPDLFESRRIDNASTYRSDDLAYGRACFVPATMIPWTHSTSTSVNTQRQNRLAAQHFLFANGYSRDWYGFDYGSLIGSFDGVKWFSIGNQRRIKSTSSKLFLAVNAYFGDVTVDNNFSVTVSETTAFSAALPDHDMKTDGAECQKAHLCTNDNDCYRQMGYDYSCQNVSALTTTWPQFDSTGAETVGSTIKTIASLVGGTNGQTKRCVYRGRGAPCHQDLASTASTFNGTALLGTLACSSNSTCAASNTASFNDRISRFASTPTAQNSASAAPVDSDIVGLGARILGRPFDFYGSKAMPPQASVSLNLNQVFGLCVPGKDIVSSSTTYDLNSRVPASRTDSSDKIFGVGSSMSGSQNLKYLNACPATDAAGVNIQLYNLNLGDTTDLTLQQFTTTQNMSSNLLDIPPLTLQNIFSTTGGSLITGVGYQRNTCLRAPGASCFSDLECGPSAFVAAKASTANIASVLNTAEEDFWKQEMTCGNPDFKYLSPGVLNPNFDLKKNFCCREFGKSMTVFTQTGDLWANLVVPALAPEKFKWCNTATKEINVAGYNVAVNSPTRYSRVHSGYDKMTCDPAQISTSKTFALSLAASSTVERWLQIQNQFKTLDVVNQRTCCTKHWVRSFAAENGGGHKFARSKLQTIDKSMFKNVSWQPQDGTITAPQDGPFECDPDNYANSSCEVKSFNDAEMDKYLTWAGSLELVGIPQVAVKTEDQVSQIVNESQTAAAANTPLGVVKDSSGISVPVVNKVSGANPADFNDGTHNYFSAANPKTFDFTTGGLKKIFSDKEFNCCIPANQEVPSSTTADQCCTGNLANVNGPLRCCLPDFTDVTIYLNRYVSSEGRGLPDSAYDPATGYIKDPGQVRLMVAQKNLCCSGTAMTGVAISQLSIPLAGGAYKPADQLSTSRRFTYRTDAVDNNPETGSIGSIFDAGVRWNNHVYCVPQNFGR